MFRYKCSKISRFISFFSVLLAVQFMSAPSFAGENDLTFPINSSWKGKTIDKGIGEIGFPENASGKSPVVVLAHGTKGPGYRETQWAKFLQSQGYVTFIVDYFWPRDEDGRGRNVPRPPEDVWGAIKFLATHPKVDITKLAVMGFSNGGSVTRSSAELNPSQDTDGILPKAFIMLYGGCHTAIHLYDGKYNPHLLYIVGSEDTLVTAETCSYRKDDSASDNVEVMVIDGAHHLFDGDKTATFHHRRWGQVTIAASSSATDKARAKVAATLKKVFQ